MSKDFLCWTTIIWLLLTPVTHCARNSDYYKLYDTLFDTSAYKKELRPALNESSVIKVVTTLVLWSIVDVDEKQQTLKTSGSLQLSWTDDFLSWSVLAYGNISTIMVPQSKIYLPDIIIGNSVKKELPLGYNNFQVRVTQHGQIFWEPSVLLSTSCDIDITYFPFDTQICYIDVQTALSTKYEILLQPDDYDILLHQYSESGQWEVLQQTVEIITTLEGKPKLRYNLLIKRRRTFYILNIVLPVVFLSMTSFLIFALPFEEGEKMGTGFTVLLSFAVYISIVSDLMPNTSLQVSILGLYLTTLLGMSAASVIVCVFVLRLHFREDDMPVGSKTSRLIHLLRMIMCVKTSSDQGNRVIPLTSNDGETTNREQNNLGVKDFTQPEEPLTWKEVAKTLDEFCLIFFFLATIFVTLASLLALAFGGIVNSPTI